MSQFLNLFSYWWDLDGFPTNRNPNRFCCTWLDRGEGPATPNPLSEWSEMHHHRGMLVSTLLSHCALLSKGTLSIEGPPEVTGSLMLWAPGVLPSSKRQKTVKWNTFWLLPHFSLNQSYIHLCLTHMMSLKLPRGPPPPPHFNPTYGQPEGFAKQ